jgi:hypothetical protein
MVVNSAVVVRGALATGLPLDRLLAVPCRDCGTDVFVTPADLVTVERDGPGEPEALLCMDCGAAFEEAQERADAAWDEELMRRAREVARRMGYGEG